MTISPHTIKPARGSRRKTKRVGRGNGSGKGTTAARGTKGQKARTGGRSGVARLGFKQSLQKIPKSRGFKSHYPKPETVTLATLERIVSAGDVVTPAYLKKSGAVNHVDRGVKIVATGEIKKKVIVKECLASRAAAVAIEQAGGNLVF